MYATNYGASPAPESDNILNNSINWSMNDFLKVCRELQDQEERHQMSTLQR